MFSASIAFDADKWDAAMPVFIERFGSPSLSSIGSNGNSKLVMWRWRKVSIALSATNYPWDRSCKVLLHLDQEADAQVSSGTAKSKPDETRRRQGYL